MTDKCPMHDACFMSIEKQYADMDKKIDDLKEDIRLLVEKIDKWGTGSAVMGNRIDTACDAIKWLKRKYEELEGKIGNLEVKIAAISAGVSLLVSLIFAYLRTKGL